MQLGIMLTNQCTAFCPHCATSSSPEDKSLLQQKRVYSLIDEAHQLSKNQKRFSICFTGGEPFLYFDQLVKGIDNANKKKAIVTCVTNGFWATSKKETRDKLNRLKKAGLSLIALSCDLFHSQYIPFDNIRRILIATQDYGVKIAIKNTILKGSPRAGDILKKVEDIIIDRSIYIDETLCLPLGRGKNISPDKFLYSEDLPQQKCRGIGNFTIDAKGNLYPCCIPDWPDLLCLGNIYSVPFLQKVGYDFSQRNFANSCHLCNEILKLCEIDKNANKVLNEVLEEWKKIKEREKEAANIILSFYN
jgi:MoaA/NifB/PqqE/SkfB family radical SAM enzyme